MKSPYITEYQDEETPAQKPNTQLILLVMLAVFSGYLFMRVQALERRTANALANEETAKLSPSESVLPLPALQDAIATATPGLQPTNGILPANTQTYDLVPAVSDKDHIRGNINAKAVLVEYSDLECPFCKKFDGTMKQVLKEYGDKVAWVYRHYPLSFHANAQKEAEATECAAELGGNVTFWNYLDAILDRTDSGGTGFELEKLVPLAEELGMNGPVFRECLDSGKYEQKVKDEAKAGTNAGISGTPGTIVILNDGKKDLISGAQPFVDIKKQLDELLK